jgi:hypothetical protein
MSVIAIDLGPNPVKRAAKLWRFWHRLAERLDALVAYPINNAVSDRELRRVDEDIKRCRGLMSRNPRQEGHAVLVGKRPARAIHSVKLR